MQSLQELLINKIAFDGTTNYDLECLPRRLVPVYRNAEKNLEDFCYHYVGILGTISKKHLRFYLNGDIDIEGTLESLVKFDKPQAFKYCCALNKTEILPGIWKNLSENEKASLLVGKDFVVTYRALQMLQEENFLPTFTANCTFLVQCLLCEWSDAFYGLYESLREIDQKNMVVCVWMESFNETTRTPRQQQFCHSVLRKLRDRVFNFAQEDLRPFCALLMHRFDRFFPCWRSQKLPESLQIPILDSLMEQIVTIKTGTQ